MATIEEQLDAAAGAVVSWPMAPPVAVVAARARAAGWDVVVIRGEVITDKAAAMAEFGRAGDFPDWFGHNLDALDDCLADLSWRDGDRHLVVVSAAHRLDRAPGVRAVLDDAVAAGHLAVLLLT